jgi:hypothetical protein
LMAQTLNKQHDTGAQTARLTLWNHSQACGLMGSPTVPSIFRLLRSCDVTHSSPCCIRARIRVGAVKKMRTCLVGCVCTCACQVYNTGVRAVGFGTGCSQKNARGCPGRRGGPTGPARAALLPAPSTNADSKVAKAATCAHPSRARPAHPVLLHEPPAAPRVWVRGGGAEDDDRGAVEQGAVGQIGVARDPAAVRGAPAGVLGERGGVQKGERWWVMARRVYRRVRAGKGEHLRVGGARRAAAGWPRRSSLGRHGPDWTGMERPPVRTGLD